MSELSGGSSNRSSPKSQSSCPYIGLINDPQTHVGVPDTRNYCHLVNPPGMTTIPHQLTFCLRQVFPECPVYQSSGAETSPEGVFEGPEIEQHSLSIPFLTAWRAKSRSGKQYQEDIKAQPLPEPEPEKFSEALSEPASIKISELSNRGELSVLQSKAVSQSPVNTTVPTSSVELENLKVVPDVVYSATPPVEDVHEFQQRLNGKILGKSINVNKWLEDKKVVRVVVLAAALVIVLLIVWGLYTRLQNQRQATSTAAEGNAAVSLATVQDMGSLAEALSIAAGITTDMQQPTQTPTIYSTETGVQAAPIAGLVTQSAPAKMMAAIPSSDNGYCKDLNEIGLQIISGPDLLPVPGTVYEGGMEDPQASWIVQNSGNCTWSKISVWSIIDLKTTQPIIKRNGQIISPSTGGGQVLVAPGEQVELILQFLPTEVKQVNDEWVIVVNGHSLVSQPHIILKTTDWLTLASLSSAQLIQETQAPGPGE